MFIYGVLINVHSLMIVHTFYIMKLTMNVKHKTQNTVNTIMLMQTTLHYSGVLANVHQIQSTVLKVV